MTEFYGCIFNSPQDVSFVAQIYNDLGNRPYCSDNLKKNGIWRENKKLVAQMPYVQLNRNNTLRYLIYDLDEPESALNWHSNNLPPPTYIAQSIDIKDHEEVGQGRCHIAYRLDRPVYTTETAHVRAIKYLHRIDRGLTKALGADPQYGKLITKNPLNTKWRVTFLNPKPYELDFLADFVDMDLPKDKYSETYGLGRNCTIFEIVRHWGYRAVKAFQRENCSYDVWEKEVLLRVQEENAKFKDELPYSQVKSIAKSISSWIWKNFSYEEFVDIQTRRAQKGGKARSVSYQDSRQQAFQMHLNGYNNTQIAKVLGVSRQTIISWLKNPQNFVLGV
jgi:hypothetical protein